MNRNASHVHSGDRDIKHLQELGLESKRLEWGGGGEESEANSLSPPVRSGVYLHACHLLQLWWVVVN